ncbi:trans-1,2-dihydrobenzene-1,2-diol dehydrogenase-like [Asterias amurensis]|uniref:trans-1,2-dihydrobenzene-1,2-diol dehydrogenase-like n=1 Tax=Asterias amurensis TaxID=7602 RepID=UPI003AB2ACBA
MKLRWGICSAGKICNDFVSALSSLPSEDHTVVAIASRSKEKAETFAEEHKIPVSYEGYEALAQDANVDIVYIGSLNHTHLPLCKLFLSHNKNVLCEKPLGLNPREVQEMISLAKEKDVFFMEGWWTRFFPVSVKLREILAEGRIGEVKTINASFGFPCSGVERLLNKEGGGGALLDLGVYCVQMAIMVCGGQEPTSYSTKGFLLNSGVDDTSVTVITFPNNAIATLTCSLSAQLQNNLEIRGTKGHIKVPAPFWSPTKLEVSLQECTGTSSNVEQRTEIIEYPLPKSDKKFNFVNSVGLRYEAECVRQCLMKGHKECPIISHKESLLVAEILTKARHDLGYHLAEDKE